MFSYLPTPHPTPPQTSHASPPYSWRTWSLSHVEIRYRTGFSSLPPLQIYIRSVQVEVWRKEIRSSHGPNCCRYRKEENNKKQLAHFISTKICSHKSAVRLAFHCRSKGDPHQQPLLPFCRRQTGMLTPPSLTHSTATSTTTTTPHMGNGSLC